MEIIHMTKGHCIGITQLETSIPRGKHVGIVDRHLSDGLTGEVFTRLGDNRISSPSIFTAGAILITINSIHTIRWIMLTGFF